jgi:FMN-dependent oxidoreductase (nitrilotriacetate monooxygenase family)
MRMMRLGLFINPTGHHQAAWRHPDSQADAGISFAHYAELARMAEAAKLDAIFLADNQSVRHGDPEAVGRVAQYVANFEPLTLLSALSVVTERIGLIATASTTYNFPYQTARKFASLDHLSGGRAGWNIVTSSSTNREHLNFGGAPIEHETRYERAAEFVEVCRGLWDSWEDDAFVRDRASGIFSDMGKLHPLDHEGTHFKVKGPLNVPRPPQGWPVHVQAGASDTGRSFAARYAEMIFTTPQSQAIAQDQYADIKARVAACGRNPEHVKVMPGLAPVVGRDEADARAKAAELQALLTEPVALNILSMRMGGMDLSGYDLDQPFPESAALTSGSRSGAEGMVERSRREGLSVRDLAMKTAGSLAGLSVCGSAAEICDMMEDWFRTGACDGFNLQPAVLPGTFRDIARWVIPELRRRGLFRSEYEGRTLRENLGLPRPANRYARE